MTNVPATTLWGRLLTEYRLFRGCSHNVRTILVTNMIYGLAMPVVYMFASTYILRNTDSVSMVVTYQLATYTGIPFAFLINGFLLRHFHCRHLFSVGMLLSGASMTIMMMISHLDLYGVAAAGLMMGVSFGFYWSNRDFLVLSSTDNENRNYYFGIDSFFGMMIGLLVPIVVGFFIEASPHWLGSINHGYQVVTGGVFLVAIAASTVVCRGDFQNPPASRFLFFRFHPLWLRFLGLAAITGLAQGYIVTAPTMLVTRFVGKEGALGTMQSAGVFLSAVLIYVIGRKTKPHHRIYVFAAGLLLFAAGGAANAAFFNSTGVIIFMLCLLLASPLMGFSYVPISLLVMDTVSDLEERNKFAYILNNEFGLYIGRLTGCLLFILLAYTVSDTVALRYALLIIGLLQLASFPLAHSVQKRCNALIKR